MGSRQQIPADRRVHAESSRDERDWRGDSGSSVEHSTGERIHALATTENLYGLTPFGETAGAPVLDFTSDAFDGRLQLRGRVFGISDTTSCALEDGLAVGPQDIVTAESSRCEETNPGGGAATTAFLFTLVQFASVNGSPLARLLGWKVHLRRAIDILFGNASIAGSSISRRWLVRAARTSRFRG
jgi:hypothetical protein